MSFYIVLGVFHTILDASVIVSLHFMASLQCSSLFLAVLEQSYLHLIIFLRCKLISSYNILLVSFFLICAMVRSHTLHSLKILKSMCLYV